MPAVGPKLPAPLFEGARLRLIQVTGAGVDRLDRGSIEGSGIPVANVPGGSNHAVAEYVVAAAAMLLRRLGWADQEIRRGSYAEFRSRLLADNVGGLQDVLAGVVGLGTIGLAVARALKAQGCNIIYHDPRPIAPDRIADLGAKPVPLRELLARSDVVTLHLPLLPETSGLIGENELALMKPGAVLIQASRGGIVDEAALAVALERGHLGGAAVDVYSTEPPAADNPLLALSDEAAPRTLLTPHIAGVTRQSAQFLMRAAWENVERVLIEGKPPLNRVY
jgi:phosphoglycerate dehydrogenase-like enzyme